MSYPAQHKVHESIQRAKDGSIVHTTWSIWEGLGRLNCTCGYSHVCSDRDDMARAAQQHADAPFHNERRDVTYNGTVGTTAATTASSIDFNSLPNSTVPMPGYVPNGPQYVPDPTPYFPPPVNVTVDVGELVEAIKRLSEVVEALSDRVDELAHRD